MQAWQRHTRAAMRPDGAAAGSQWGSTGAQLEGDRSTRIALVSGVKPEQSKGTGLGGYRASYQGGWIIVSAHKGEMLMCGVRETQGPAWQ
jgi:hypothetical protein